MQVATAPPRRSPSAGVSTPLILGVALVASVAIWAIPGASIVLLPVRPYLTFVHEG